MNIHELYMERCFELAKLGIGGASPNPLVGSLIVLDNRVVSEGYHQNYGLAHAEPNALNQLKDRDLKNATLYCNLEPCSHIKKKTPPCVDLIIQKKIKRVVISNKDPNPEVSGRGIQRLREAGVEVIEGVLESEGEKLNEVFFTWMRKKRPFIHLKVAQSMDGKICSESGESKWISDEYARKEVHEMRLKYDAVMIGRNTFERDNPSLNIRLVYNKNKEPYKIIVGSDFSNLQNSKIYQENRNRLILVHEKRSNKLEEIKHIHVKKGDEEEYWHNVFQELSNQSISSVLVEGGETLLSSLIKNDFFDRLTIYHAPLLIGNGKTVFKDENNTMSDAKRFAIEDVKKIGDQVRVDYIKRNY